MMVGRGLIAMLVSKMGIKFIPHLLLSVVIPFRVLILAIVFGYLII